MKRLLILFFSTCYFVANSQVLTVSNAFTIASPSLETLQQISCAALGKDAFISLNKTKGAQLGTSTYVLEKYNMDLTIAFSIPLSVGVEEDYKELHVLNNELYLFSEIHDMLNKKKALKVYRFNLSTGALLGDKIIHEQKVNPWLVAMAKGASKESFEQAVSSALPYNFNTPLEYQYSLEFSPDKKIILVYTYDYSQKTLVAETVILDAALNVLQTGNVSIDNNFVNYGIFVNNRQELHILNCDKMGRIVLVRFDLATRDIVFLDVQGSISKREGLRLCFLNDDEIYVANITVTNKKFSGIMYSKFNFNERIVEKLNFYDLSDGIKQTSAAIRSASKTFSGEENWMNYQITNFYLNEYEKIILVLEKKDIESIGYVYESGSVNDIKNWQEKLGKVHAESVVLYAFNKKDELLWENYFAKNQVNDISGGITSSSYTMHVSDEGKVRMLYASSDNATGVYNQLKYVEWDELSGNKVKEISLENIEGLTLLRNYSLWWENKLFLVGKKGLLGKKTYANLYDLSSK
jgi:hypothetical protein